MNAILRSLNTPHRVMSLETPLTTDQMRKVAPSIFAREAHESRSDKFVPVPTIDLIDALKTQGFEPFYAAQSKTRDATRKEFTKHLVRLRHRSLANEEGYAYEVALLNANDGAAAYNLFSGALRFVCLNGMVVSDTYDTVKVRHNGRSVINDVIEGTYKVLGQREMLNEHVGAFKGTWLTRDHKRYLAEAVSEIRWPREPDEDGVTRPAPIPATDLLATRRDEDQRDDLWTVMNRIQENAIRGGQRGVVLDANNRRRSTRTRPVDGIDQSTAINRAIWKLAEVMETSLRRAA